MRIACLSGKGGAGKTFVAVNLAAVAGGTVYVDCDVEEPNGRLFLRPEKLRTEKVSVPVPTFDKDLCDGCKKCVEFCRFHALVCIKGSPMVFPEICHSCGGCAAVCPRGAVREKPRVVGELELGEHGDVLTVTGVLDPGEASGVPVIRAALSQCEDSAVIDCPPGSACSVMESVSSADFCLIVAEPTAFGLHNFKMVHELVSLLGKKCGAVVNKQEAPYGPLESYCLENGIPVLGRIPFDPGLARRLAGGELVSETDGSYRELFLDLLGRIGGLT